MFVKPAPGRAVRWPVSMRLLNEAGENVPSSPFWLLALHHKDVVVIKPPVEAAAIPAEQAADVTAPHEGIEA
ncbi:hypothetical protein AA23498_1365 [Acetobacter nitrogenifigens DSM 23921 = NBRC 105050]|uniref:DUF2635 domain-containing protein n=1 Tax=Acetobacter nitrogenifigens DSM 23921 = NBRC 105050 TaxID=1120919 RepID=A0A511X585_9PROT|nr:DUF2635 domain-containing protein [Acetobacter nitrogenifigens]GBQ92096.1 hypothetical protein AA23498_1365 [Acetobacter nitrogenifigens DSM 23921 = NBRC 105050]GEN58127.1 hypothetical protein ANI02nite_00110 [Acetobacter nitrogenifigens DSM 23921 = NBRC 105050]